VIRSYCAQVLKQARLWERLEKGMRAEQFTFAGDPMRLDLWIPKKWSAGICADSECFASASRCEIAGVHGRSHTGESEVQQIYGGDGCGAAAENERHRFVQETLRDAGVDAVPVEAFAVWTAKVRPMIQ
jgi:hypothetical protein